MQRKKLILIMLFFLIFSGCSILPQNKSEQRSSTEEITLKPEGTLPIDLIILVDQSGSMNGAMGEPATDPKNLRVGAVKYFIDNYSTKSNIQNPNRIGVINFGSNAYPVFPLTKVYVEDQENVNSLISKIKATNLGSTSFINALKAAKEMFLSGNSFNGNRATSIVIFTDGEPYDDRKLSISAYFKEIETYINQELPSECQVFLVGIDGAQKTWSRSLPYWEKILPKKRIFKINEMETLKTIFNDIVRQIFQIPDVPPDVVGNVQKSFIVPPYIDSLELHAFFEGKTGKLNVYDPSGSAINFESTKGCLEIDKGSYTLYIISSPQPGEWSYKMVGATGTVEVYKNFIPVKASLFSPISPYPVYKKSKVLVEFIKKDGTEMVSDPNYPLRVVVSIKDNRGNILFSDILQSIGNGIYESSKVFEPASEGTYQLEFEVAGGTEYSYSYDKEIKVITNPYLEPIKPTYGEEIPISKKVNIEVALKKGINTINPTSEFQTNELLLVRAQLSKATSDINGIKEIPKVFWLDPVADNKGVFSFILPIENPKEGRYTVLIELNGKLSSTGEMYSDLLTLDFSMKTSLAQRLIKYSEYLAIGVLLLWLVQWIIFIFSRKSKIREIMDVSIYTFDEEGSQIEFFSKRMHRGEFFLVSLQNKKTKSLSDFPKGLLLLSANNSNLLVSFFRNRFEYILMPLFVSALRKKSINRGLNVSMIKNIFISTM